MTVTSLLHQLNAKDLTKGIIRKKDQIETNNSTSLIEDLEISDIFKNKDDKEGNSVIDKLVIEVSWLLGLVTIVTGHIAEDIIKWVQVSYK